MYRLFAVLGALALLLSSAPAHARWEPSCYAAPGVYLDGAYHRTFVSAGVAANWELTASVPVTLTITGWRIISETSVYTTITQPLFIDPYIVQRNDSTNHLYADHPFSVYQCAPGTRPHVLLPYIAVPSALQLRGRQ